MHAKYGFQCLPMLEALFGRIIVGGVLQIALAIVCAIVFAPLASILLFLYALATSFLRILWDGFVYFLVLKRRARIPGTLLIFWFFLFKQGKIESNFVCVFSKKQMMITLQLELLVLEFHFRYSDFFSSYFFFVSYIRLFVFVFVLCFCLYVYGLYMYVLK